MTNNHNQQDAKSNVDMAEQRDPHSSSEMEADTPVSQRGDNTGKNTIGDELLPAHLR